MHGSIVDSLLSNVLIHQQFIDVVNQYEPIIINRHTCINKFNSNWFFKKHPTYRLKSTGELMPFLSIPLPGVFWPFRSMYFLRMKRGELDEFPAAVFGPYSVINTYSLRKLWMKDSVGVTIIDWLIEKCFTQYRQYFRHKTAATIN